MEFTIKTIYQRRVNSVTGLMLVQVPSHSRDLVCYRQPRESPLIFKEVL